MKLVFALVSALGLALSGSALAQTAPAASQPVSPPSPSGLATDEASVAKAQAKAQAVLDAANATDVFDIVAKSEVAFVRHKQSGLLCPVLVEDQHAEVSVGATSGLPRGDDVSCTTHPGGLNLVMFAIRYPQPHTLDQRMSDMERDLHKSFSDVRPIEARRTTPEPAQVRTRRYTALLGPNRIFIRLTSVSLGPWIISSLAIGPVLNAVEVDRLGGPIFAQTLKSVAARVQEQAPAASPLNPR